MKSNSLLSVAKTLGLLKKSSGFLFSINKKVFIFTIIYFIFNGFYSSINVNLFRGILNNFICQIRTASVRRRSRGRDVSINGIKRCV